MKRYLVLAAALAVMVSPPAFAQGRPTGLHGVKIAVADYDRTTRFYAILGMVAGTRYNPHEWELRWADPAKGSVVIMVKEAGGALAPGGAFLMISVADVPATVARFKEAGFPVAGEPLTTPRSTIMMLKDPDGNSIELLGGPFGQGAPAPHH